MDDSAHGEVTVSDVAHGLKHHEARSEERFEALKHAIERGQKWHAEGKHMSHEKVENKDTVNVYADTHRGGDMGGLGALAALAMGRGGFGSSTALGAGALGFVAGALVNNGNGGLFGGNHNNSGADVVEQLTLSNIQTTLGGIDKDIFVNGLTTNNQITTTALQAQIAAASAFSRLELQAAANASAQLMATKDAQYAITINDDRNAAAIQASICALSGKIDANTIAQLQAELAESRHSSRAREAEVNVNQNVNQQQQAVALANAQGEILNRIRCMELNHQQATAGILAIGSNLTGTTQAPVNVK